MQQPGETTARVAGDFYPRPDVLRRRFTRVLDFASGRAKWWSGQAVLIHSLSEMAAAVSMKSTHNEILATLVDEARRITNTDKVVLCLFDETGEEGLEGATIVARGRRSQFPEEWWRAHLGRIAEDVVLSRAPRTVRDEVGCLLCVPVVVKNRPIGLLLSIDPKPGSFTKSQQSLMAVLGAFAGSAIENARLLSQSQLALLEGERARIAKEMHDGLSQSLFSVSLDLETCRKELRRDSEAASKRLEQAQATIMQSLAEVRRYIYDLRPVSLYRLGLAGSINVCLKRLGENSSFEGKLYVQGRERRLEPNTEACLYRVALEAIANAAKHARASSVTVLIDYDDDHVDLVVEDDGRGFSVDRAWSVGEDGGTVGLRSMRDRVRDEGGDMRIVSGSSGGTLVRATVPC